MTKKFKHFAKAMRKIRSDRILTQAQIGKTIGVHPQYVSNCERGICSLPKKSVEIMIRAFRMTKEDRQMLLDAIICDQILNARAEWEDTLRL